MFLFMNVLNTYAFKEYTTFFNLFRVETIEQCYEADCWCHSFGGVVIFYRITILIAEIYASHLFPSSAIPLELFRFLIMGVLWCLFPF